MKRKYKSVDIYEQHNVILLQIYLKQNKIKYETSDASTKKVYCIHFELLVNEEEEAKVNEFLEKNM